MQNGASYQDAKDKAKQKTVYTNHTLVSAGNQSYNNDLLKTYGRYYAQKMGITINDLLEDGIENSEQQFVMTRFALNTSTKTNGVSQIHSKLCQENWPEYNWTNITNAVHMPTWQDSEIRNCNKNGNDLWFVHQKKKQELMEFVTQKVTRNLDENRKFLSQKNENSLYNRACFAEPTRFGKNDHQRHEYCPHQFRSRRF